MGGYSRHCPSRPHEPLDWAPSSGSTQYPHHVTPSRGQVRSLAVWGCWKNRCHPGLGPRIGEARVMSFEIQSVSGHTWLQGKAATACLHQGILSLVALPEPMCQHGQRDKGWTSRNPQAAGTLISGTQAASWSEKLPSHSLCICLKTGENLVFALSKRFQS